MRPLRFRLPPSSSLIAFEAAARLGSYGAAAEALSVTPGAITQQISRLEEFVGIVLFRPHGRGRRLTAGGEQLYKAVAIGLEHIASAITRIKTQDGPETLTISAPLAFTGLWLVPRIVNFRREHPDIALRFVSADTDLDPVQENLSLAVRYGNGDWPHLRVTPLLTPQVFPVCTEGYLRSCGRIESMSDLLEKTLLDREESGPGSFSISWTNWLDRLGVVADAPRNRIFFNSYEIVVRAALAGQGIALGVDVLVDDLVRQGLLISPIDARLHWREGYYLVSPKREPVTRQMKLFSDWLLSEVSLLGTASPASTTVK